MFATAISNSLTARALASAFANTHTNTHPLRPRNPDTHSARIIQPPTTHKFNRHTQPDLRYSRAFAQRACECLCRDMMIELCTGERTCDD